MVVTKIVDLLVEPLAHRDGIDLYQQGANLAMANYFYFALPHYLGKGEWEKLTIAFVEMVRSPNQERVERFYRIIRKAYRRTRNRSIRLDLGMLLATQQIADSCLNQWDGSHLDPAIPAFVEHAAVWTERIDSAFQIVHDESKPIAQEQIILEAMMSPHDERVTIGYDRRKMKFPIRAVGIQFRESKECVEIQVADIIASAAAYYLREACRGKLGSFAKELLATRTLESGFHPLWPEPKVTPEELGTEEIGGINAEDYMGEYVARRLGEISEKGSRRKE